MTILNIAIGLALALSFLATCITGATAFSLRSSDAAGNGLALAYLLVFAAVQWGLLGLSFLLASIRGPHASLQPAVPWPGLTTLAAVLMLIAAAATLASIVLLSDRRVTGPYQLAPQLSLIAGPLAIILHLTWRTYAPPVPGWAGLWLPGAVLAIAAALPWPGIAARPGASPMTADRVHYPALLLWEGAGLRIAQSPGDLDPGPAPFPPGEPLVIDALFKRYTLRAGGLKKLAAETPTAEVRERIFAALPPDWPDTRRAELRDRLARVETLDGMIRVLRGP